jgi:hypothetical protein
LKVAAHDLAHVNYAGNVANVRDDQEPFAVLAAQTLNVAIERAPIVRVPTNRRKFAHRQIGAFAALSQGGRPTKPTLKQATRT